MAGLITIFFHRHLSGCRATLVYRLALHVLAVVVVLVAGFFPLMFVHHVAVGVVDVAAFVAASDSVHQGVAVVVTSSHPGVVVVFAFLVLVVSSFVLFASYCR